VEKVFDFLERKKWSTASVSLVGITGQRTDFTLYNLHLLRRYGDWDLAVYDDFFMVSLIDRYFEIHGIGIGSLVSLLPAEGPVRVTAQGVKYPVRNALLKQGVHESISNRSTSATVIVRSSGPLFVFIAHEFSK
jgi:thiamine pyrophosphokinase